MSRTFCKDFPQCASSNFAARRDASLHCSRAYSNVFQVAVAVLLQPPIVRIHRKRPAGPPVARAVGSSGYPSGVHFRAMRHMKDCPYDYRHARLLASDTSLTGSTRTVLNTREVKLHQRQPASDPDDSIPRSRGVVRNPSSDTFFNIRQGRPRAGAEGQP